MKKYRIFIMSAVITILTLVILTAGYHYLFGVKESYTLSSEVSFYNKDGLIEGYAVAYDDCKNENGDFELKIKVGSQESRKIGFEISALLNFEQQCFNVDESHKEITSSVVFTEGNKKELTVILDKKLFTREQNQLIINIRQDIQQLSYKNELVRDSNTLNFTFYVTNKDGKKQNMIQENLLTNVAEIPLKDTEQRDVIEVYSINHNNDALIRVKKKEEISVNLGVGGRNAEQYIIWAYLDSKQVNINGNKYNSMKLKENTMGNTTVIIENNMPAGNYELEIYCVPSPYEEDSSVIKEIISAKRYTIEVE